MAKRRNGRARWSFLVGLAVLAMAAGGASLPFLAPMFRKHRNQEAGAQEHQGRRAGKRTKGRKVSKEPLGAADANSVEVTSRVVELAGIRTAKVKSPSLPRTMRLRGVLDSDPNRLQHVHARFPGEIVEVATIEETIMVDGREQTKRRPMNFMDRVSKGQPMAVLWSKELGEKKSELVDALSRLRLDKQHLKQLKDLEMRGATTEQSLREAERYVEADEIAVERDVNTLRAWSLQDEEIDRIKAESERIHETKDHQNAKLDPSWARVEILAPFDGTIVEKNVNKGELVDSDTDLFKVADLSVLVAWAHVHEEDLAELHRMPRPIPWTIRLNSNPDAGEMSGFVERIGDTIDPFDHMALVAGEIDNPRGELHSGQFITATIELPPDPDVVEIPTRALVEDGVDSIVLVQTDKRKYSFKPRKLSVVRRERDRVLVRSRLTEDQKARGLQELHLGETVVAAGALELREALLQKQSQAPGKASKSRKPAA